MKIGRYELGKELGRGGMGIVHEARSEDGKAVAVKLVHGADAERLARFDRERRLQGGLSEEDGFVPLLDAGLSPRGPYLVMPLVTGGSLRARLAKGRLGVEETVSIGRALACALAAAHERGIVHRDLKPENVLFADKRPLVTDLGLAKHFDRNVPGASESVPISQEGFALGSGGYMSPEMMFAPGTVGPAADVFALGAILYECLAGVKAFPGATPFEAMASVVRGSLEPVEKVRPETPSWLADVIARALAREVKDRFPDGGAMRDALGARAPRRRRWLAPAAVGAAALVGVIALSRPAPVPPAPVGRITGPPAPPPVATPPVVPPQEPPPRARPRAPTKPPLDLARLDVLGRRWTGAHEDKVLGSAFSPDGERVATGSGDGHVFIWDARCRDQAARPIQQLEAHRPVSWCVAFTPDGRRLVSAGHDGHVFVWDTTTWKRLDDAPAEGHQIEALAISDYEKETRVAVGDFSGVVVVYRLEANGKLVRASTLRTRAKGVSCAAWLPGGDLLTGGLDCRILRTELASGKNLEVASADRTLIVSLALSPDADMFVTAGWKPGTADVWRMNGEKVAQLEGHTRPIRSVAFSPDGRLVATGSLDHTVKLWRTADWKEVTLPNTFDVGVPIGTLAFSPEGTEILVGADRNDDVLGQGRVMLWELGSR